MSFASQLKQFADKVKTTESELLQAIMLEAGNSIIELSPVDTGRFRANWQHGTGSPAYGEIGVPDPSGGNARNALQASIANIQAGGIEYITNNLPYAQELEYGHSQQAPGGMVRVTAARFQGIVNVKIKGLKK